MDREMTLAHLAMAEKNVALGERHIEHQGQLVSDLDRHGHDTTDALALLDMFRRTQLEHVAHRDFLLKELQGGVCGALGRSRGPGHEGHEVH
jgi:hypothetical protein